MKVALTLCTILLFSLISAQQEIPIPRRPYGYRYAPTNVSYAFTIENFIDLGSPASAIYLEQFNQFLTSINYAQSYPFQVIYYFYPQPNNTISYWAAIGANVVANVSTNPADLWTFVNNIMSNQKLLNNLLAYTQNQTINAIASAGLKGLTGITLAQYMQGVQSIAYDVFTGEMLGYCIGRRVTGAPYAIANGAPVDGANLFNAGSWTTLLQQIGVLTSTEERIVKTKFSAPTKVKGYKIRDVSDL